MSLDALPSPDESDNAVLFTDITDNVAIRNAVNELMERYSGYNAVFAGSGDGAGSYRFVVGSKSLDCSELAQRLRSELGAKCGGNKVMIQGSVEASQEQIMKSFEII